MKIAVIGATGKAGSRIAKEAKNRGHEVTAIIRNVARLENNDFHVIEKDAFMISDKDIKEFDVVVNAFGAPAGYEQQHVEVGNILIEAMKKNPSTRLIVVGGAGSLFVDVEKKVRLIDTPDFPDLFKPTAVNQLKNLEILEKTDSIKWTFVSPSALFAIGQRTGSYIEGNDHLLVNSKEESYVSYEDYAVAIVDEIERPKHINKRFTVASESI